MVKIRDYEIIRARGCKRQKIDWHAEFVNK